MVVIPCEVRRMILVTCNYVCSHCSCSGPKRYDLLNGYWTYRHDGSILHDLLAKEFSEHLNNKVDLSMLENYYKLFSVDKCS